MVVFTCNHCGDSLQKPRVEKHYQFKCRKSPFLTCVDCLKDFRDKEYVAHTKCFTEAERYGGKDYVPKSGSNKGEQKQQEWLNIAQNLLNNAKDLSTDERKLLQKLTKHENLPRKKAKFFNFINSAFGRSVNNALAESIWLKMEKTYLDSTKKCVQNQEQDNPETPKSEQRKENNIAENQNNENICKENKSAEQCNGHSIADDTLTLKPDKHVKKSKKRLLELPAEARKKKKSEDVCIDDASILDENQEEDILKECKFNWKKTILKIMNEKKEISLHKLQREAISQYKNYLLDTILHEKAVNKFEKIITKVPGINISEGKVVKLA